MSNRRADHRSIDDIIAGIVNKNSPQPIKGRNFSQRPQYSLISRIDNPAFLSKQSSLHQTPKQKGSPLPNFKNWFFSTPKTPSRLFNAYTIDKPVSLPRKYSSSRQIGIDNPQKMCNRCQLYETYGPFKRKSSKVPHHLDATSPKAAIKLIDNFRQARMHAKVHSRTTSPIYHSPHNRQDLAFKVNSTLITLQVKNNQTSPLSSPLRFKQSPFLTFYR